jgi:long-chain acyl-CoA synthetase
MSHRSYIDVLDHPVRWLDARQIRWLEPRRWLARFAHRALYSLNWLAVHCVYRFSVEGLERLPTQGPYILAPNHSSPLDPSLLGAALPLCLLQHTFWAGKRSTVLKSWFRTFFSWAARVIPIEDDQTALAPALVILEQGENLIWFPEGKRALNGRLQAFKPGIAHLVARRDVPIVPIFIQGAFAAFPSGAILPRWRATVVVRIGPPLTARQLGISQVTVYDANRAVARLRQRVKQLDRHALDDTHHEHG